MPGQVSFVGDSAGGALSIASALYCRDNNFPLPGAVATLSPYVSIFNQLDISQSLPSWYLNKEFDILPDNIGDRKYINGKRSNIYVSHDDDLTNPLVSPILAHETEIPMPPMLIQVSDSERLRDDSIYFAEKCFGHSRLRLEIYKERIHVFQLLACVDPYAKLALARMGSFLESHTGLKTTKLPEVKRETLIVNPKGVCATVDDAFRIVEDGMQDLVEGKVWDTTVESNGMIHCRRLR